MNTFSMISALRIATAVAAIALLTGCATNGASLATKSDSITRTDRDYVRAVENAARYKGVRVVWVNPPPELGKRYLRGVR